MTDHTTSTKRPTVDMSQRKVALTAGLGLLLMAVLAPLAHFGVLQNLVVPADATATVENIIASGGLFRLAIATLLVVTFLDILVAWALYVLLKPVNETLALLVGWLRLAAPAVFAVALANLLDVAKLLGSAGSSALQPDQLGAQVMASIASFGNGWDMSLAIFGLHLVGLGYLLFKSVNFPRFLGVLVVVAGGGYLADTFARILVPDFRKADLVHGSALGSQVPPVLADTLTVLSVQTSAPQSILDASASTNPEAAALHEVEPADRVRYLALAGFGLVIVLIWTASCNRKAEPPWIAAVAKGDHREHEVTSGATQGGPTKRRGPLGCDSWRC